MRTFQGDSLTLVTAMSWLASPVVYITLQSVCSNVLLAKHTKFALISWWKRKFSLNSDDIVLPTNKTSWEVCFSARLRCFISFVAGFPSLLAKTAVAFRYRAQKQAAQCSVISPYFIFLADDAIEKGGFIKDAQSIFSNHWNITHVNQCQESLIYYFWFAYLVQETLREIIRYIPFSSKVRIQFICLPKKSTALKHLYEKT